jgi:hypothetical protein
LPSAVVCGQIHGVTTRHAEPELGPGDEVRPWLRAAAAAGTALALTVPFILLPSFPAGDLHSHLYNAWLVPRIERGELPGLHIAPMWTNVLLDRVLVLLLHRLSPRQCEMLVLIGLAHLFVWSSFLLCRSLSRRPCWQWLPVLTVLGLGWTFHMGFANWTASAGLALLAVAVALSSAPWWVRAGAGGGLGALALVAHALPVVWASAGYALVVVARRRATHHGRVLVVALIAVAMAGAALRLAGGRHIPEQYWTFTGADQLVVFDPKYVTFMLALLLLWAAAVRPWVRSAGNAVLGDPAFVLAVVASVSILAIPDTLLLPGFPQPASFVVERASIFAAIAWTAVAARSPPSRLRSTANAVLAVAWFGTAWLDWTTLARYQASLDATVRALPEGARVIAPVITPRSRAYAVLHALDRACVGHCFAWANYEPSSAHFRVRAEQGNGFVVSRFGDLHGIYYGGYRAPDLASPLWRVHPCPGATDVTLCASRLRPGDVVTLRCVDPFARRGKLLGIGSCRSEDEVTDFPRPMEAGPGLPQ